MIRLTLNTPSGPEIHLFSKSAISMGSDASQVDLFLPITDHQPIYLKIIEQDRFLVVTNVSNDPFISLNGHPFGKKLLNNGDIILVHEIEILFENLLDSNEQKTTITEPRALNNEIETQPKQDQITQSFLDIELPFEEGLETLADGEWHPSYVDQFLGVDLKPPSANAEDLCTTKASIDKEKKPEYKNMASLKDDYMIDLEDEHQSVMQEQNEPSHLYQAWKWILLFIFSIFSIAGIAGSVIYFSISDKKEDQETRIAQGMADVAMALLHAQLNHLKPSNQNWSDVDFLKASLQAILPETLSYASEIDSQGQFRCFPYSLRIYTSSDLSRFLLIAQPAPSLLQWLIPKSVILVDSQAMELRIAQEVRSLNRLLASPDPLDGTNGKEISALVKQGTLIRLATLATDSDHLDFAPPTTLAWIRPGSENHIYNAPRYYRLAQSLIQKTIALSTNKVDNQEVASFQEEVDKFARLNSLILYADQGKKLALQIRQDLLAFNSADKLLFGYLTLNVQGKIYQVHLLKDEDFKDLSISANKEKEETIAFQDSNELNENRVSFELQDKRVDINHSLYIQLMQLAHQRQEALKPLMDDLCAMLERETLQPFSSFEIAYQNVIERYAAVDNQNKEMIKSALNTLHEQYQEIPIEDFLTLAQKVGFEELVEHNGHN